MADYFGTDEDDVIDASDLESGQYINIYPGKGNDEVINATNYHTIVNGEGEDTISGANTAYALWNAQEAATINLKEGWSDDGLGSRDTLKGVTTVHTTGFDDTLYGTDSSERVLSNGGNNKLYMAGGDDEISYAGNSFDYTITPVGDEIHVQGPNYKDIIVGARYLEFRGDNKKTDLNYLEQPISSSMVKIVHTFTDDTMTEAYSYSGADYLPGLINWFPQKVFIFDVNNDGIDDVILPMGKGYGQKGINSSTPFIALTVKDGSLVFDDGINATMPSDAAAGRAKPLFLEATQSLGFITSNIYTAEEIDRQNPDYSITPPSNLRLTQKFGTYINPEEIFPELPNAVEGYPLALSAHSMATGDINGDGLDDVFMGDSVETYALLQQKDGTFVINKQSLFKILDEEWPLTNNNNINGAKNYLLDAHLIDINNDGYDDLLAGFGGGSIDPGSASTVIFINDEGKFTENNRVDMPDSIYGVDAQMHLLTFPADFDHDGDIDIAIQYTRPDPYYGGYYIQINLNDGKGNFTDVTNLIPENSQQDAYQARLTWVEPWQMIDVNNDGHIDIAGSRSDINNNYTANPVVYFNDGSGRFEIGQIGSPDSGNGKPYAWGDFDQDQKIEYVTFTSGPTDISRTESIIKFYLYEVDEKIGTGPNFSNTTADQGAPGFNERYYLNENSSAQEAVTAGTYDTGLAHYLAEGKDEGLKTFAHYTKVYGYSGNDNIVLREGNETAYGYAGDDSIEGGAGNDIIDGGAGLDTAIYKDSSSNYELTANDDGTLSVVHSSSSEGATNEGKDTLTSIEKMQFSDKTISSISLKYALSETIDSTKNILESYSTETQSGTQNFNSGDNIIVADGQAKTLRGLDGDDTYFISNLLPEKSSITIIDTSGINTIQIPANTAVTKSQWAKDTVRLTFEDSRVITVNNADTFSYSLGGNVNDGTVGTNVTFSEMAEVFGVYDVLNLSGSDTGTLIDLYII